MHGSKRILASLAVSLIAGACAGATIGSGVGDAHLLRPPYYAGNGDVPNGRIVHAPIVYQRGSTQSPIFEPSGDAASPVAALLAEMNAYLESLGATTRLTSLGDAPGVRPDVIFGCRTDAAGECEPEPGADTTDLARRTLRLAVARPNGGWADAVRRSLDSVDASGTLLITLEVGQYYTRQRNLRGDKEVQLGTGYSVPVPWLTSLETPVTVLQLTGAVLGKDGKAIRAGAEGIFARRTRLLVSAIGAQELLSSEDVQTARTLRREDLSGQPLVWQVALRNLVGELTGRRDLMAR
jgi:hypothetical protein